MRGPAGVQCSSTAGHNTVDENGANWWVAEDPDSARSSSHEFLWIDDDYGDLGNLRWKIGDDIDSLLCAGPQHYEGAARRRL